MGDRVDHRTPNPPGGGGRVLQARARPPFLGASGRAAHRPGLRVGAAPGGRGRSSRPADAAPRPTLSPGGSRPAAPFFPFPTIPLAARLRPQPGLPRRSGDWRGGGDDDPAASRRSRTSGCGWRLCIQTPRASAVGWGAWPPPGECPAPLSTTASLPSFYGDGEGARVPARGGRSAAGRPAFALFGVAAPALPSAAAGAAASLLRRGLPPPSRRYRRTAAGAGEGRGPRGCARSGREFWMGFPARVSVCVRRAAAAGPARPPRASEVRVPGQESGGGGREGRGRGAAAAL